MSKNKLESLLSDGRNRPIPHIIGYLMAGFPSRPYMLETASSILSAGVSVLEIGVPFSDPVADGPTIQHAAKESLRQGTNLRTVIEDIGQISYFSSAPVVVMSYLNPILAYGLEKFARDMAAAGASGIIIPDLPFGVQEEIYDVFRANDVAVVYLLAPTTPERRARKIAARSQGFLYCVSVTGITGARESLPEDLGGMLERIYNFASAPIAVGFGISKREHLLELAGHVDAVVIGSAIINAMISDSQTPYYAAKKFVEELMGG
jgi:tryptophan synthase alpha chain